MTTQETRDARACALWGIATWLSGVWLINVAFQGWTVVFAYSTLVAFFVSSVTVIYAAGVLWPRKRKKEES